MGRPGLTLNRKFKRLAMILNSDALARGHLELIWDAAYESGEPEIGDAVDVELAARWQGDPGVLVSALVEVGLIDQVHGRFLIHDFWHHAPAYVRKSKYRENERRKKSEPNRDQSVTSHWLVTDCRSAPLPHPHPKRITLPGKELNKKNNNTQESSVGTNKPPLAGFTLPQPQGSERNPFDD